MPAMPEGAAEGILRGLYKLKPAAAGAAVAQLFGSGPILNEVLAAQAILAEKYGVQADVWSVPSYVELRREALAVERWNRLHPAEKARESYLQAALAGAAGPIVATSDYMKSLPDTLAPWLGGHLVTLGTDGFGRSDNREHLRRHFEVNAAVDRGRDAVKAGTGWEVQAEAGAEGVGRAWGWMLRRSIRHGRSARRREGGPNEQGRLRTIR